MQTVQPGDRVRVHYVIRFEDGTQRSSRPRIPIELTVGESHPRLPGLGLALVGMAPGTSTTIVVPPESAYGPANPSRIHRWSRTRFAETQALAVGQWVPIQDRQGRRRLVRIVELRGNMVVVDTNHRRAGQALELEVELISILAHNPAAEQREA